jgi:putative ABC transport system permease protein
VYENGAIITTMKDAQDVARSPGQVTAFSLRVRKTSDDAGAEVERVRQKIQALIDPATKEPYRLEVRRPEEYLAEAPHIQIAKAMAWVVSLIALLIGVISMLNTMAMSVLERTQEIGILRAVGWPRRRVMIMVLGESVLLALAAAAVGVVGAIAATYLLALSPRASGFIAGGIAPGIILQGFGITVLIGLLGGAYPAIRAARLLPTEAIRHD